MTDTNYNVNIKYAVDSRGGRQATGALNEDVKTLHRSSRAAEGAFIALGQSAINLVTRGFGVAKQSLIGFNSSVEDTKLQIAGMLALSSKTSLADQIGNADRVFANLQRRAASLPGTTAEYAKMAGMLTQPIMSAGLRMKDLEDLTVSAVVGAKALGVEWQAAARDVDQALRGQFHSVDQFTGKILGSVGFQGEEGRAKFNALSAERRAAELKRAMTQPQLEQLAAAQGATFAGAMSTLQDSLEQTMGRVGVPLFKAITAEIKAWNMWLDKNALEVGRIAASLGDGLAKGFGVVKDAVSFLVEHQDAMLALGKVWLAVKLGGLLGGGVGGKDGLIAGGTSQLAALRSWARPERGWFDETGGYQYDKGGAGRQKVAMGNVVGSLPLLAQSAALGYALGSLIDDATGLSHSIANMGIDAATRRFEALEKQSQALGDAMDRAAAKSPEAGRAVTNLAGASDNYARMANLAGDAARSLADLTKASPGAMSGYADKLKRLEDLGVSDADINKAGGLKAFADQMSAKADDLALRQQTLQELGVMAYTQGFANLTEYQRQTLDATKAQQDLFTAINRNGLTITKESILAIMRADTSDPEGKHKPMADKPNVSVHIARIEVQSDDPDRFAFGLVESFRDAAKNPSSAFAVLREG